MHRRSWLTLSLIIILLALSVIAPVSVPTSAPIAQAAANAQTAAEPIVFLKDGDLWKWDGSTLAQISTWGYNERPVLSPDGTRIAYNSWATVTVQAVAAGNPVFGVIPSNIWVMDILSTDAFRAADQPANASFYQQGVNDLVVMRGTPAWSPDGSKLVWSELLIPDYRFQLVVYDLATGTLTPIVQNLPGPYADAGIIPVHDVMWGNRGIVVRNGAVNSTTYDFEERAYLYAPDGTLIHDTLIGSSATEWVFSMQWVMSNGQQYLGLVYPSGKRFLMDPATGDQQDMPALPELYSQRAPSNAVTAFVTPNVDTGSSGATWSAVYPTRQQEEPLSFTGEPFNIAVAPDGQALVYITDAVYVWRNGQVSAVPGTQGIASPWDVGVVWGASAWRVRTDSPGQAGGGTGGGPVFCGLTPRLTVGGSGQVTPGLPNALRTQPRRGSDSLIVGEIPAGGVFSVISGPQCGPEGRYWWQVNYQGVTGWTAEGQGGYYWLQPYQATQPTPVACTATPRLQIGTTAYVLPGLPNVLRTQPQRGTGSLVLGVIPGSGVFTVLGGPQCDVDGIRWWQVNYQGITGWTGESQGSYYWAAPFGCPASPAPRLAPGMQASVTPGEPNRLRSGPGTNYDTISSIPAGGIFTVLSGPQCGPEGWSYWRVQYGSTIGWTAEGSNSTYWVQPVTYAPPPIPTPIPVSCTLSSRLAIGGSGRVTPGLPNVLRTQPWRGAGSSVLLEIPAGGVFTVLSGPQCDAEGILWWQVSYNGVTGWTGEGQGSTYWVEPFSGQPGNQGCFLPTRLTLGATAYVIPGPSNVLRSQPYRQGDSVIIGQIPGGGWFRVISGPQCDAEGIQWWQVAYNGVTGWTGESQGDAYWVEPYYCGIAPTRLMPGISARVTPGDPNVLRSAPGNGSNSAIIGQIPGGGQFTVLSGPQCGSDSRIWWQVNYNGQTGWTAEGEGSVYWVEPLG